ncbi:DeoR/GlpR family DNA-binding transcription regulator [Streptomyces aureus]|uniref:Lactose phosphotransferase system repressor n=1 Tax=Streptomyces aureus TaxID=193461 RepID=A0ABV4SYC4_9ACTN
MLAAERHTRIVQILRHEQVVTSDALARELAVSGETIRRDLLTLERRGALTRVHGGATGRSRTTTMREPAFEQRKKLGNAEKERIGRAAAALVRPGQTIMIDVGTTALMAARALPMDLKATIVTSSLVVVSELADRSDLDVLSCGGHVRAGDLALSNATAVGFFEKVYPDIALLGSGGLHPTAGLTDYYLEEAAVRKAVIRNARQSFALVDSTKFGHIATHEVADLSALVGVVVDSEPKGELRRALSSQGTSIVAA